MSLPLEQQVRAVMSDLGCDRMQALNHVRQRKALQAMSPMQRHEFGMGQFCQHLLETGHE